MKHHYNEGDKKQLSFFYQWQAAGNRWMKMSVGLHQSGMTARTGLYRNRRQFAGNQTVAGSLTSLNARQFSFEPGDDFRVAGGQVVRLARISGEIEKLSGCFGFRRNETAFRAHE
jgi:hypothetical protein